MTTISEESPVIETTICSKPAEDEAFSAKVDYGSLSGPQKKAYHLSVSKMILKNTHIFTMADNGEMFIYQPNRGIYVSNAEGDVGVLVHKYFGGTESNACVSEVVGSVKRGTRIARDDFTGASEDLICILNGVLNIKTRELKTHSPEYHFLAQLPIKYDPNAKGPAIDAFLEDVTMKKAETIRLLEEIIGWCLMTNRYYMHKIVALVGSGRNGKTTFLNLLRVFLGANNCSSVELKDLCENRFATANLYGKLANICTELTSRSLWSTGKLKSLTGEDSICGEHKFRDSFQFTNKAKMLFSTNELPKFTEDTLAIWSRFIIIDFPNQFLDSNSKTDKNILAKLTSEAELSGLLNRALDGLDRLFKNGVFTSSITPEETREKYLDRSDPFYRFVNTCLTEGEHSDFISRTDMFNCYKGFCSSNNVAPPTQSKFTRDFNAFIGTYAQWIKPGAFMNVEGDSVKVYRNVRVS